MHGCTRLSLNVGGKTFCTEFVVVSPLTSEAILGIGFLQAQQAQIDLGHRVLHLCDSVCDVHLTEPATVCPAPTEQLLRIPDTVKIPPRSVMDVAAVCATIEGGVASGRGSEQVPRAGSGPCFMRSGDCCHRCWKEGSSSHRLVLGLRRWCFSRKRMAQRDFAWITANLRR